MNNNQISVVTNLISDFENIEIEDIVAVFFINQDVTNCRIGHFLVPEYVSTIKRLMKQLQVEINENAFYLPFQYNYANEFGNGNLQNDLNQVLANLKGNSVTNLNNTVGFIDRLVYYQISNGFWDKSIRKIHKADELELTTLTDELRYMEAQNTTNSDLLRELIGQVELEKENLKKFIQQKTSELQQIDNNLQSSNTNTNQITQLLNTSTATTERINSLFSQQEQTSEAMKKEFELHKKEFEDHKKVFSSLQTILETNNSTVDLLIDSFNNKLAFIEEKKSYFEERNTYLDNLIGREVGVSLFETFKQRKNELEKPVSNWRKIVIGASILTFIFVLAIFTNGFGYFGGLGIPTSFTWQQVIVNSLKSSPFFFLLFYSISQYNKERNF